MMCVDLSDVTMPLAPEVRLQHETSAETMIIKANGACSHEASACVLTYKRAFRRCALFSMRWGKGCVRSRAHVQVYIHAQTHTHAHTHVCARLSRQGAESVSSALIARGTKETKPKYVWMWCSALGQSRAHIGCLVRSARKQLCMLHVCETLIV